MHAKQQPMRPKTKSLSSSIIFASIKDKSSNANMLDIKCQDLSFDDLAIALPNRLTNNAAI
jgi:hypothetical protein